MSHSTNGRPGDHHDPIRRLRYDDLPAIMEQGSARRPRSEGWKSYPIMSWRGRSYSGRRFVIVAVLAVLVIWGLLYAVFREWRARYRVRAAYGASQVVPAIDPLAEVIPPGIDPAKWRDAVDRTHAMLLTVTGSNLLGLAEMRDLRDELDRTVFRARARPETAVDELAAVWDDMSERGEFLLKDTRPLKEDRHPRPGILPSYGKDRVAPALDPLAGLDPPGVTPQLWRDAVARTRALLLDVTAARTISILRMQDLRRELDQAVARARAHPESAVDELAAVWDALDRYARAFSPDRKPEGRGHTRPAIFPPHRP
jgi:hypothetical protein